MPPAGYLRAARALCAQHNVLFIADEIQVRFVRSTVVFICGCVCVHVCVTTIPQSGLGRSGTLLAFCGDCAECPSGVLSCVCVHQLALVAGGNGQESDRKWSHGGGLVV